MSSRIQKLLNKANAQENESSVSFFERVFADSKTSRNAFDEFKEKILKINVWNALGNLTSFDLFDEKGTELKNGKLKEGIFLRISLQGSGKYDWVKVLNIFKDQTEQVITVSPTHDPTDEAADKAKTSHFFTAESTNNFCLLIEETKVVFYVIGLNEKQNISETKNVLETVRNIATANIGSYLGIQKSEWEVFSKDLLNSYQGDLSKKS